jgi:small-conductance mechanosensitive channel
MNTRSTVLITPQGNHVQIPNAVIFKSTIENQTAAPHQRDSFLVGIGYDDTMADAQKIIQKVLEANEAVIADPPPMALIHELGASTVDIQAYYWFDGRETSYLKLKSALLRQVKRALTDAGVSMPDAAREVIFPQGIPLIEAGKGMKAPSQTEVANRWPLDRAEPEFSANEADLSADHNLIQRQASAAVEEGEADLLSK